MTFYQTYPKQNDACAKNEVDCPARTSPSIVKFWDQDFSPTLKASHLIPNVLCSVRCLGPMFGAYSVHYAGDELHKGPRSALNVARRHGFEKRIADTRNWA